MYVVSWTKLEDWVFLETFSWDAIESTHETFVIFIYENGLIEGVSFNEIDIGSYLILLLELFILLVHYLSKEKLWTSCGRSMHGCHGDGLAPKAKHY